MVKADKRERYERLNKILAVINKREEREAQRNSLLRFVQYFWPILEPKTPLVLGWPLEAICEHLEAVTRGDIKRLLINVSPGFMKSLLCSVFWPAWEWAIGHPNYRYVMFSYSASLTVRDNNRFRDLMMHPSFVDLWGDAFSLKKVGEILISNDKTGWKLASSVGGVGTGERGDRVILDDGHNIKEAESETIRTETVRWFRESISNRLNDMEESAIIVIGQRVHDDDVSGAIITNEMGYTHLMIPMEYDPLRHCETEIGWSDPRDTDFELAWPERFPERVVTTIKRDIGSYAFAGQYQQSPEPRGGGIFKRDHWQLYPPEKEKFDADGKPLVKLEYPQMDFIMASLDTAMATKEENDYSALVVLGCWTDFKGIPKCMLMDAWQERLEFTPLVERILKTCKLRKIDLLLIESKANGQSVAQEIRRLTAGNEWAVKLDDPKGDKVSRANSVEHLFENKLIYAPDRKWADMVINQMAKFPHVTHDDIVDAMVAGLRYLRRSNMLQMRDEVESDLNARFRPMGQQERIYPSL